MSSSAETGIADGDAFAPSIGRVGGVAASAIAGLSILASLAAAALTIPLMRPGVAPDLGLGVVAMIGGLIATVGLTVFGALVVLRGRGSGYGWLMLGGGAVLALVQLGQAVAVLGTEAGWQINDAVVALAVWTQDLWMVWFAVVVLLLPARFPDGRAMPRWRTSVRALTGAWAVVIALYWLIQRPAGGVFLDRLNAPANPTGILPLPIEVINAPWGLITLASAIVTLGSIISRWRTADDLLRQQLRLVLSAFGVVALSMAGLIVDTILVEVVGVDLGLGGFFDIVLQLAWASVGVAVGVAVLQYRLYDVDLVLNRTLVYGITVVLFAVVYVGVVVLVGSLASGGSEAAPRLVGTIVVAAAFAPARTFVQRAVNRLMFGHRDEPLVVLSSLDEVLARAATPEDTLEDVVATVARTLKLPGAAADLAVAGGWDRRAVHGSLDGRTEHVPLRHAGKDVGRLVVARRSPAEPLNVDDLRVLGTVAHHVAALAHGLQLTAALQRSRERLVLAREEERRRLRRDLHDGFGPTLASHALWIDAIRDQVVEDPPAAVRRLAELKVQTQGLIADIRRLVYDLRPPSLDELGLVGALSSHIGTLPSESATVSLHVDPDPLGELPAAVESAVYRIAVEAITNVLRHAAATCCTVTVARHEDVLSVVVVDDGGGIGADAPTGVGVRSMRERAEELGGTLHLGAGSDGGTRVEAVLPLRTSAGAPDTAVLAVEVGQQREHDSVGATHA